MSTASALVAFLRLVAAHKELPSAAISDVVLLLAGHTRAIRFAVSEPVRGALDAWAPTAGFVGAARACASSPCESGWNIVSGVQEGRESISVVVYGPSRPIAEEVSDAEAEGNFAVAGRAFSYPDCCIAAYADYLAQPEQWLSLLLERSGPGPYPRWANRLPLHWGAPTFVGELYPCSFHCSAALARGRLVEDCLREMGLRGLAEVTARETTRSVGLGRGPIPPHAASLPWPWPGPPQVLSFS